MQPERSTWNVYVSPLSGLPMYVRRDVDEDRLMYGHRVAHEMTRSYYGRPRYRINVKPKQRPQTVWYDSKGEHVGGMPICEYFSPETLRAMWGEIPKEKPSTICRYIRDYFEDVKSRMIAEGKLPLRTLAAAPPEGGVAP